MPTKREVMLHAKGGIEPVFEAGVYANRHKRTGNVKVRSLPSGFIPDCQYWY
jgi:hypothetical protein